MIFGQGDGLREKGQDSWMNFHRGASNVKLRGTSREIAAMPEKAGGGAREEGRESNPEGLHYTVWTEGKKRGRQGNKT